MGNSQNSAVNFLLCASVGNEEADEYDDRNLHKFLDDWASLGSVEEEFLLEFTKVMQQGVKFAKVSLSL